MSHAPGKGTGSPTVVSGSTHGASLAQRRVVTVSGGCGILIPAQSVVPVETHGAPATPGKSSTVSAAPEAREPARDHRGRSGSLPGSRRNSSASDPAGGGRSAVQTHPRKPFSGGHQSVRHPPAHRTGIWQGAPATGPAGGHTGPDPAAAPPGAPVGPPQSCQGSPEAGNSPSPPRSGAGMRPESRRPLPPADSDHLGGRWRPIHYSSPGLHPAPRQWQSQPGNLPPAGL